MKAVILARVSTKEQEEHGHSLPAQVAKLKEYAARHNFEIAREFAFSESAGTKIRNRFEEVLAYLKRHKDVNVLLCQNVDRATRNFSDAVDIDNMRINEDLEVHFVQDGFVLNKNASGADMFMWEAKVFIAK
jgi:DNA invertase Pin-like site-specific DNA recombinase